MSKVIGDAIQQLRDGGYGSNKVEKDSASPSSRTLVLTDDEIGPIKGKDGEVHLHVYGKMSGSNFTVSRVECNDDTEE